MVSRTKQEYEVTQRSEIHDIWQAVTDTNRDVSDLRAGQSSLTSEVSGVNDNLKQLSDNLNTLINRPVPKIDFRAWLAIALAMMFGLIGILGSVGLLALNPLKSDTASLSSEVRRLYLDQQYEMNNYGRLMEKHVDHNIASELVTERLRGSNDERLSSLEKKLLENGKETVRKDRLDRKRDEAINTNANLIIQNASYLRAIGNWDATEILKERVESVQQK